MNNNAQELFEKLEADGLPPYPGKAVYGVFVQNLHCTGAPHLVYIGSSQDVEKRRLNEKHPYKICFRRFQKRLVYLKVFYTENYRKDEITLIKHFRPILNKQHRK